MCACACVWGGVRIVSLWQLLNYSEILKLLSSTLMHADCKTLESQHYLQRPSSHNFKPNLHRTRSGTIRVGQKSNFMPHFHMLWYRAEIKTHVSDWHVLMQPANNTSDIYHAICKQYDTSIKPLFNHIWSFFYYFCHISLHPLKLPHCIVSYVVLHILLHGTVFHLRESQREHMFLCLPHPSS